MAVVNFMKVTALRSNLKKSRHSQTNKYAVFGSGWSFKEQPPKRAQSIITTARKIVIKIEATVQTLI